VSQVLSYFFSIYHKDGVTYYSIKWGLEFSLAYVGHSVVLCIYTLFILPQWWQDLILRRLHILSSCLLHIRIVSYGAAFFQAHENLKSIYLTFGYVGVAHWAAVDGRPQRWT